MVIKFNNKLQGAIGDAGGSGKDGLEGEKVGPFL